MREKLQETMRLPFFLKRTPEGTPDVLSSAHPFPFVTEIGEGQLKSNHIFSFVPINIIGPCSLCDLPVR